MGIAALLRRSIGGPIAAAGPKNKGALFPRLQKVAAKLPFLSSGMYEPSGRPSDERVRLLEAKVEYLLDELYRAKAMLRVALPQNEYISAMRTYQAKTFDFQWNEIVYHDQFLSNPAWTKIAADDVAARADQPKEWFKGKKILDAGCGPGRHTWAFATLGAHVTAFDVSPGGLDYARKACAAFPNVTIEQRSILDPLPYTADYDLVWCYGVVHHTGDTLGALANIARHAKPGGLLYFMVYTEPRRGNVFDYQYYHEICSIREAIRRLSFQDKREVIENIEGPSQTLAWFDAISSEINDLYTFEELEMLLAYLGFTNVRRTMPDETMHNVVARRLQTS
jgi:SAM-dependent methyltransferase